MFITFVFDLVVLLVEWEENCASSFYRVLIGLSQNYTILGLCLFRRPANIAALSACVGKEHTQTHTQTQVTGREWANVETCRSQLVSNITIKCQCLRTANLILL